MFDALSTDPPWLFGNFNQADSTRGARKEYPTQGIEYLKEVFTEISPLMEKNSVMLIWAPDTHISEMLEVIKASDFKYVTKLFTWVKMCKNFIETYNRTPRMGMGFYTRKETESCYLAKRGKGLPKQVSHLRETGFYERSRHSEKPPAFNQMFHTLFAPKNSLELFARTRSPLFAQQIGLDLSGLDALDEISLLKQGYNTEMERRKAYEAQKSILDLL